jgi:ATP-dependent DNA helicase RecQ
LTLVLTRLEDAGAVTIEGDHIVSSPGAPTTTELAAEVVAEDDRHKEMQSSRLEMMRQYAETHACRRRFLLTYFGEDYDHNCGHCDNCESGLADRAGNLADHDSPFPFGIRVRHAEFGDGLVIRTDRDRVVVLFDEAGYRTLSVELALEHGLLTKITS